MSFRYIGSKVRVADSIKKFIGRRSDGTGRFIDAFCGTGVVAESASDLGWPVWLNDFLVSAGVMGCARLMSASDVSFECLGSYKNAVSRLNDADPERGFIWQEYSPASAINCGIERRYFTELNACRIDAARATIRDWKQNGMISPQEERLLIADVLAATNRVANIAGTYGCFLSKWTSQAMNDFQIAPRPLKEHSTPTTVSAIDVSELVVNSDDLVYLDPPYTKRQYASYYHILETITLGDEPNVEGVSGLRPWRSKASAFCYKRQALGALVELIGNLSARRILLSYSGEGHVPIESLHANLRSIGSVECFAIQKLGRYRPNRKASSNGTGVTEYLFQIEKSKH